MTAAGRCPARTEPADSQFALLWKCFSNGRNWLFSDTVASANAAATLYSLVQTCKANNIAPYKYLIALFKGLPHAHTADNYEALLPGN